MNDDSCIILDGSYIVLSIVGVPWYEQTAPYKRVANMDLLSDILSVMRLSGTLYFRTAFTAPWGIEVPSFEHVSRFHYVHRGRCFAHVGDERETVLLEQGDLIIITRGACHILSDPVDVVPKTVDQVVEESGFTGRGALVCGGESTGHETQLICGHFAFDAGANHFLFDALPPYVHVRDFGKVSPGWLDETLKIIGDEVGREHLGSDLIALKLSEIIFAQAIRAYVLGEGRERLGLAALADAHIRRALEAIHTDPAKAWSVDSLARVAGLSRTAFSNRFSALIASTPLSYLTTWRMQLARHLLLDTDLPIIEVASRSGYQSEASFGRVFKRHFESAPAGFRRNHHAQKTGG